MARPRAYEAKQLKWPLKAAQAESLRFVHARRGCTCAVVCVSWRLARRPNAREDFRTEALGPAWHQQVRIAVTRHGAGGRLRPAPPPRFMVAMNRSAAMATTVTDLGFRHSCLISPNNPKAKWCRQRGPPADEIAPGRVALPRARADLHIANGTRRVMASVGRRLSFCAPAGYDHTRVAGDLPSRGAQYQCVTATSGERVPDRRHKHRVIGIGDMGLLNGNGPPTPD